MSDRKLVSVITATYNRPRLINRAITQVRNQTYPEVEHCIVSDGPDKLLSIWNKRGWPEAEKGTQDVPIKFVETGRQWSQFLENSISAVPFQTAQWLSSGDYLMWFADDEEISPDHIESLVDLIEKENVDFVYSKTEVWFNPEMGIIRHPDVIGSYDLRCGNITQALYRAELLDYRGFMTHVGSGTDWDQIKHWIDAGASHAFLDRVTHTHRVDKLGDTNARRGKQPLKGRLVTA
jgi:hypothetical protein